MNYKDRWKLCLEARQAWKRDKKARRKLKRRGTEWKQRNSWKATVARSMRLNPTKCEAILFDALNEAGIQFLPQVQIGPYIADCVIKSKIVVEVDGPIHDSRKQYDLARDTYMWNHGYRVIRFKNAEVSRDVVGVLSKIKEFVE